MAGVLLETKVPVHIERVSGSRKKKGGGGSGDVDDAEEAESLSLSLCPLFLSLSLALSLASRLTVEQILTERDIAPNACLFISMPVTDGSSAGGSFTRGGATRRDTRRHTQCTHAAIYIGSDMYIQPRAFPRGCLTIAIDDDSALVSSRAVSFLQRVRCGSESDEPLSDRQHY